jgi:DNA polymerase-3 subunit alpha
MHNTYGVMLYQEQVMQMVQIMANYSLGQADMFRRAIGRKDEKLMKEILPPFITACQDNGFTEKEAELIADYINGCSDYLFNMGHSAGYGYIAYQTAFLKAHFPVQFLCALLNVYLDDKDAQTEYMADARALGIDVLPPNIAESKTEWSVTKEGALRVGFGAIRNVGNFAVPTDEAEFHNFMKKYYHINKKVLVFLVKAGCFTGDRGLQLAQIDWYKCHQRGFKRIVQCLEKIQIAHEAGNEKKILEWTDKLNQVLRPSRFNRQ